MLLKKRTLFSKIGAVSAHESKSSAAVPNFGRGFTADQASQQRNLEIMDLTNILWHEIFSEYLNNNAYICIQLGKFVVKLLICFAI